MTKNFLTYLSSELRELRNTGLYKSERVITSKQAGTVALDSGWEVINLCANNYLGLSDNAELIEAGREALARYGYGMSSVRFIRIYYQIVINSLFSKLIYNHRVFFAVMLSKNSI